MLTEQQLNTLLDNRDSSPIRIDIEPRDIKPSIKAVARYFGGPNYPLTEKTRLRIQENLDQSLNIVQPLIGYRAMPVARIDSEFGSKWFDTIWTEIIADAMIANSPYLAVFIATLGGSLENECRNLAKENQVYNSMLLDAVGTAMLDELGGLCNHLVETHAKQLKLFSGCRLGPGLNGIAMESNALLFDLLGKQTVGVHLNDTFVMQPAKSISAFVVYSETEQRRNPGNKCLHCSLNNCQFRNTHKNQGS